MERWNPAAAIERIESEERSYSRIYREHRLYGDRPRLRERRLFFPANRARGWPCGECGHGATAHKLFTSGWSCADCRQRLRDGVLHLDSYDGVRGREEPCLIYVPQCGVCGGYSPSATETRTRVSDGTRERICRPCRRLIKRRERFLWESELAEWKRLRWERWQALRLIQGKVKLQELKRLLRTPEALQSARGESVRATISRISCRL